jgi:hypothetical protein
MVVELELTAFPTLHAAFRRCPKCSMRVAKEESASSLQASGKTMV